MTDRLPPYSDEELKELLGNAKDLAFLHVAKTGGTYAAHQLLGNPAHNYVVLRHTQPARGRAKRTEEERWIHYLDDQYAKHNLKIHLLKHYFGTLTPPEGALVFATVRNPFDWIVSLYASNYRGLTSGVVRDLNDRLSPPEHRVDASVTLEEFIESFIKLGRTPQKRFAVTGAYWPPRDLSSIPASLRHNADWLTALRDNNAFYAEEKSCLSLSPLYQLFKERDASQVAFVLRQEMLDAALEKVIYYFVRCGGDFNYVRGIDTNVSNRTNINNTHKNAEDYKDIFCAASREMVEEHYGWELDLLGYDFEKGVLDDNPILDFRNAKWPSEAEGLK